MNDFRLFLAHWIRNPLRTGAVLPSGSGLARRMADQVDPQGHGLVVELGAGTGVITRALLERSVPIERLVVVEASSRFCSRLRHRFPGLRVVHGDARRLASLIEGQDAPKIDTIVSSLPLLSLARSVQEAVLRSSFELLDEHGTFVQFTYGLASPVRSSIRRKLRLRAQVVGRVLHNLPPATVWSYANRRGGAAAKGLVA